MLGLIIGGFCRGLGEAASGRGPEFSGWKPSRSKLILSLLNSDLVIGAYVGCFALALEYVFIMSDSGGRIGQSFLVVIHVRKTFLSQSKDLSPLFIERLIEWQRINSLKSIVKNYVELRGYFACFHVHH